MLHEFDEFFAAGDYKDGDEPQAFADYLASKTGTKVVGMGEDGVVVGEPEPSDPRDIHRADA